MTTVNNAGTVSSDQLPDVVTDDPATAAASMIPPPRLWTRQRLWPSPRVWPYFTDRDGSGLVSPEDTLRYSVRM